MVFLTSIIHHKHWLPYLLQVIKITRWKMMKIKTKVMKIRIRQTQLNSCNKTKVSIKTLLMELTNRLVSI